MAAAVHMSSIERIREVSRDHQDFGNDLTRPRLDIGFKPLDLGSG